MDREIQGLSLILWYAVEIMRVKVYKLEFFAGRVTYIFCIGEGACGCGVLNHIFGVFADLPGTTPTD